MKKQVDASSYTTSRDTTVRQNTASMRERTVAALTSSRVRVVVLDECSHAAERGANLSERAAADHFKTLVDRTGVALVLVGLPRFQALIDGNEQLRDRTSNTVQLLPYDWRDERDRDAYCGAVSAAIDELERSDIAIPLEFEDVARRLYGASGGRVAVMLDLLSNAVRRTTEPGVLDLAALSRAERSRQRLRSPDGFFSPEPPEDQDLIRSFAGLLSEAGLRFAPDLHYPWQYEDAA